MIIKNIKAYPLQIPLKLSFEQANSKAHHSSSIILELETQSGYVGYGECCPRSYVTGENTQSVLQEIQAIIPQLLGVSIINFNALQNLILHKLGQKLRPAALCAFDLALLDAFAKESQTDLPRLLGGEIPQSLTYTGVIPMGKEERIRPILEAFSFQSIKIKVSEDFEAAKKRIEFIRSIYGDQVPIRIDVNTSWTYLDASLLIPKYLDLGVSSFEQPFLPKRNKDMGFLTRYFGGECSIMADESLTTPQSAFELISHGYCNHFNLKVSKHGGILRTLRIYELARIAGISCQLGAHFGETSILTKAGMVVAALAPGLTHLEGAFGTHVLQRDIFDYSIKIDRSGNIRLPQTYFGTSSSNHANHFAKAS